MTGQQLCSSLIPFLDSDLRKHTSCPAYHVPVFALHKAGDIRSHHQGCVAGVLALGPGKGCVVHGVQIAFQSCFSDGICPGCWIWGSCGK